MAKTDNLTDFLADIADGIRAKKGTTDKINPQNFRAEIESIQGGAADSPLPIEVSTEAEMTALLGTAEIGSVYKYVGESGTYENGALYIVEAVSE